MSRITPKVDIAFKKIFGVEENKDLLISLINSIVSNEDQVEDLTILNPYNPQNFRSDKLSILDIKAVGVDGKRFNIEIQITDEADYDKRALFYWAKLYTEQLKEAGEYSELNKAIGIHILNFISITENDKYHNSFHITEKDTGVRYFSDLELHTIELKKFLPNESKEINELVSKIKDALDIWLAFLTRNDLLNKDNLPPELDNAYLKKALSVLEVMNFTDDERSAYEDHLKWMRIEANTLKKTYQKGIEEGIEQGIEKGMEKGIEQGIEKGIEEGIEQTAIKMLKQKLDHKLISDVTGLSREQIIKLANKQ
ncbi:unnamed protein product [Ectocarpus sp. 12 AP-2014]